MHRRATTLAAATLTLGALATAHAGPETAHHDRGTAGIFWFVHLTDSHIGATPLEGPDATEHFEFALNDAVAAIDPSFVVATGDLVDGSLNQIPAFGQEQSEWDTYRGVLTQAGMTPDFYFDLPGNHDGYGDLGLTYYLANSMQGQATGALFVDWTVQTPVGEYYFFGLNSAGDGSGPFLQDPEFTADEIAALDQGLQDHASAQLVFALAHHPMNEATNGGQVVDLLSTNGGAYYLHGHVHAYDEYLAGQNDIVVNQSNTLGKSNSNNLAVGVIDHNGFIYRARDVVDPWPFVMVTTPVSQMLRGSNDAHPYTYDVCKDRPDNPFRAVVFAAETPSDVTLEVGSLAPTAMTLVPGSGSLYEAELDTTTVDTGYEQVTVTATVDGVTGQHSIETLFVPGPCEGLPNSDDAVGGGGGAVGGGGAGGIGAGGSSSGGTGGIGAGGTGTGGVNPGPPVDLAEEDGGCGCRQVGTARPGGLDGAALWLAGWALMVGATRRRRRRGA